MLRLRDPQESLWDQVLPPQARTLSAELTAVDECLADDRFFAPYRERFHTLIGRPTVPVETYLSRTRPREGCNLFRVSPTLGRRTTLRSPTRSVISKAGCLMDLESLLSFAGKTCAKKMTSTRLPTLLQTL